MVIARLAAPRDEPVDLLAVIQQYVEDNPGEAACALFAAAVQEASDPNLAWLFDEWKRRKRQEIEEQPPRGAR
jgi:hypothetical protein